MRQSDVLKLLEDQGEDTTLVRRIEFGVSHYTIERLAHQGDGKPYAVNGDVAVDIATKPYEPETPETQEWVAQAVRP